MIRYLRGGGVGQIPKTIFDYRFKPETKNSCKKKGKKNSAIRWQNKILQHFESKKNLAKKKIPNPFKYLMVCPFPPLPTTLCSLPSPPFYLHFHSFFSLFFLFTFLNLVHTRNWTTDFCICSPTSSPLDHTSNDCQHANFSRYHLLYWSQTNMK